MRVVRLDKTKIYLSVREPRNKTRESKRDKEKETNERDEHKPDTLLLTGTKDKQVRRVLWGLFLFNFLLFKLVSKIGFGRRSLISLCKSILNRTDRCASCRRGVFRSL